MFLHFVFVRTKTIGTALMIHREQKWYLATSANFKIEFHSETWKVVAKKLPKLQLETSRHCPTKL